ncbi:MAG: cation:proton antiporter [Sterolibacteriaceae bacterium]|nr:cation:proton antiporter [Sterolibacteriaceae bacterium]
MHSGLEGVLILLIAAVLAVWVVRHLHLPALLGYLLIGIAVGPHGLSWLPHTDVTDVLADFGVVFLMFSIGLEFSRPRLFSMWRLVFGLGSAQVAVTILVTVGLAKLFSMTWQYGLVLGSALAMSSTAIVSRLLAERADLHSTPGRQTMGVLLFQDLAVVPLMIAIPALASERAELLPALGLALGKAALILAGLLFVGQKLMSGWFDLVARQKSTELFMLNVLLLIVGLAFLTSVAGLSLALGAFLGGVLISETLYRHQVASVIRPFRDILLGLFFVTVGMQLNLQYVAANPQWIAAMLALVLVGKGVIVFMLSLLIRNQVPTALSTAVHLAQAGEFGFVLVAEAVNARLLDPGTQQVTLAAMLLSMLLTPLLIERGNRWSRRLSKRHGRLAHHDIEEQARQVSSHVIICGYGRTGQSLARFLDRENIPFVALDTDPQRVRQATAGGERVLFGDADRREVLLAAGLERARAVVLAYADLESAVKVLRVVREIQPHLPVIVRAKDDAQLDQLKAAGATEVVPEILEASLQLAMQTLSQLGVPTSRTMERVREIRGQRYEVLRHFYRGEEDQLRDMRTAHLQPRRALEVPSAAHAIGERYLALELTRFPVKLIGFVRHGIRCDDPAEEETVAAGDVIVLDGADPKLEAAEQYLLAGTEPAAPALQRTAG